MALMFPDTDKSRVVFPSRAEEQFYRLCRDLSDEWRVYYSCTLSAIEESQGLVDNEIDFVLYHPALGLVVVEVKGGQISFDAGRQQYYSVNRHGQRFPIRNPFQQALAWKSRFLRYLKRSELRLPITHMVCFPAVYEEEFQGSVEIEATLLLGRQRLQNLAKSLEEAVRLAQPERYLSFQDVSGPLDQILKGASFTTRIHLRDYLDEHETKVKDVEVIHETFVTPVASAKRLAIEGEAGTGKTMLAVMLARHFRGKGKRVLLLSTNALLNARLREDVGEGITIETYAEMASSYGIDILRRPPDFAGTREDWIQFEGPEKLKANIQAQAADRLFDVVLCDEAQDVQPFWWDAIECLVAADEDSHFYIFFDGSQGVFGSGGSGNSFVAQDVLPIKPPYFPLVHNYRTTREIASFARQFRTGHRVLESHSARLGYLPEVIRYRDEQDFRKKLTQLSQNLMQEERIAPSEMVILSARSPFNDGSLLNGAKDLGGAPLRDLGALKAGEKALSDLKSIGVSTIAGFKGLEAPVGIVVNLSEYNMPLENPIMASLLYVACSRAKHMLYVFVREDDSKALVLDKALEQVEHTGSMVLEKGVADYEFTGVVTHYNPERVGWLKVEDASFERGSIMFFPHDVVQAKLSSLQVGSKLRFRPRVEGATTIACDLIAVS